MRPGDKLGPYEILGTIGAGGMGEVFRARDTRLNRDVAIKVLPPNFAADVDRLRRFEQEAKTLAALNHPNVLVVFDTGTHDGAPYLVSELLEGRTLRDELARGALSLRKSLDYGLQIANGLAAAHARGVVHRDLKPENVFVTNDGRAKILDFGLAKLRQATSDTARARKERGESTTILVDQEAATVVHNTEAGVVLGTPSYMSPEQVAGQEADHRADIFSFGAILYEMLAGVRAFRRETGVETMTAILKDEPPELTETNAHLPPGLDRVVRRCLEKRPEQRFQSASDLGFALQNLSTVSTVRRTIPGSVLGRRIPRVVALGLLAAAIAAIGGLVGVQLRKEAVQGVPTYQQLTFQRGTVANARIAPDGETVVFSARWGGRPMEIFSTRPGTPEARSLNVTNLDLLAISPSGELAVLLNRQSLGWWFVGRGTLARMPLGGGAPRPMLDDVQEADWFPNGTNFVVTRWVNGRNRLEVHPGGTVLAETGGYFSHPRVSPGGDSIAYMDHPIQGDNRGVIRVTNRAGKSKTLTTEYSILEGLAWQPDGGEIWFTAVSGGEVQSVRAVNLQGKERIVLNTPVNLMIHDLGRDGRLLVTRQVELQDIIGALPPDYHENNFTWMDRCQLGDISRDARTFLLLYFGEGAGGNNTTYLSYTDGSPAIRLGEGHGHALSPDGRWIFASTFQPRRLFLMPTGAGEARNLSVTNFEPVAAAWLADSKRLVVLGSVGTNGQRYYLLNTETGETKPITPEGASSPTYFGLPVSPDGRFTIGAFDRRERHLFPVEGGPGRPLPGLEGHDIAGWSADGGSVFAYEKKAPVVVQRYDLATGHKEPIREIYPTDLTGTFGQPAVLVTPDGKGYVYYNWRLLTDLFLIRNLR